MEPLIDKFILVWEHFMPKNDFINKLRHYKNLSIQEKQKLLILAENVEYKLNCCLDLVMYLENDIIRDLDDACDDAVCNDYLKSVEEKIIRMSR